MANKRTKKPKTKKKTGRPKADIDKTELIKLAGYGCNDTELGDFFNVHPTTIYKRFSNILIKARAERKSKLRKKQFEVAVSGNVAMLIWLGKQELGQTEKSEIKVPQLEDASFKAEFKDGKYILTRTKVPS